MRIGRGKSSAQRQAGLVMVAAGLCLAAHPAAAQGVAASASGVLPLGIVALVIFAALAGALIFSDRRRRETAAQLVAVRRREAELRASAAEVAARLRALDAGFETAQAAAAILLPGDALNATPKLCQLLAIDARTPPTLGRIFSVFEPGSGQSLAMAVATLRQSGREFDQTLKLSQQTRYFRVSGRRLADGGQSYDVLSFIDVTEATTLLQQRDIEALRLRTLVDILPIPVWARDGKQRIRDCNASYVEAVEAPTRDAVFAEGREFAEGPEASAARALAERVRATGQAQTETKHIVVSGRRRLFEITESPLAPVGTAGYAIDVTHIEDARQSLRQQVAAHNEVLERLALAIIIVDTDGSIRFFNSAFAWLWKVPETWLEGGPSLADLLDRLSAARMLPETGNYSGMRREWLGWITGLIEPRQELLHLPNDMSIWMVVTPHPLGGLLFTFENVTDRLALERSVSTLSAVQRDTIDHLFDGIAVFGEDGCLKLSNPAFRRMWRLSEEFIAGNPHVGAVLDHCQALMPGADFWHALRGRIVARIVNRVTRQGRIQRTDGLVLNYVMIPLPDGGVLVSCRDISDSKRAERALRERAEALEAADRVKADFIANMSYELRTPLNAIIGFTEILNNQYFGQLNPRQFEYTEGILDASKHLMALINDILDLAVIEAGRMVLDPAPVAVRELIDDVVAMSAPWARNQQVKLVTKVADDIGVIHADAIRLKQALYNLVGNSIKFTSETGLITLSAERRGERMLIAIEDTGIGIPDQDQARVFGTFVRGRDKSGRTTGPGLGLSLVRNLIELHGGTVTLESTPGVGTKVTCDLPVRSIAGGLGAAHAPATPALGRPSDTKPVERAVA